MKTLKLDVTKTTREKHEAIDWNRVFELSPYSNGPAVHPTDKDVPLPWDATIDMDENNIIVVGHIGPGGFGDCKCTVPRKDFNSMYVYTVEADDLKAEEELIEIFKKASVSILREMTNIEREELGKLKTYAKYLNEAGMIRLDYLEGMER